MGQPFSPIFIETMLHIYALAEPITESTARRKCISFALCHDMIDFDGGPSGYRCTDRGLAYVDALKAIRVPIAKTTIVWVQPE